MCGIRDIYVKSGGFQTLTMNPLKIAQPAAGPYNSMLAHEVRNPLTSIDLSIAMLLSGIKDEERKDYLDVIMRSSIRINDLINELIKCQKEDHPGL
jgi:signal transduction histidine kinase